MREKYESLALVDLKAVAKARGLRGISTMKKDELVEAMLAADEKDKAEGVLYKNVIGTYLHGPLLPKNPHVCDLLLANALERKYGVNEFAPLDDTQELEANRYIVDRFVSASDSRKD